MTIIAAIVIFCLLILSHELGHFLAAKACRVYVDDFSLGMGPKLLKWQGKETQYTLRLLPVGGWCKMRGEDEHSDDARAFCQRPVWQRILIVAAGPVMNFLFAIILFIIVFMMIGTYSNENLVGATEAGSPAEIAGLLPGDRILSLNGVSVSQWQEISAAVKQGEPGQAVNLVVDREGSRLNIIIQPYFDQADNAWRIGVLPMQIRQNIFTAIGLGVKQSLFFIKELLLAIAQMISGTAPVEVAGPVGIVTIIGDATSYGIRSLILLTAYLSLNLGLINLFPLPALDGSRIVFLAVEGLRGKPIDRQKEGMVHFVGLMLLLGLMAVITFNDIAKLLS